MLLLVKNKNGELETRDMLDIDFNMKVEHIGKNQFVLRINKSLVYPDTFRHEKQHRIKCLRL